MNELRDTSKAEAVIFDIDGVLINSNASLIAQADYWLRKVRHREMAEDDLERARVIFAKTGNPRESMQEILQCDDIEWHERRSYFVKIHQEGFELHKTKMVPYIGAVKLVKELAATKRVAAFTARKRSFFTAASCPQLIPSKLSQPHGIFHTTVTADDVDELKPHPEGMLKIAIEFQIKPSRMILVGDSPTDIIAGKKAGALTVAMVHDDSLADVNLLAEQEPDFFARSFADLRPLLFS